MPSHRSLAAAPRGGAAPQGDLDRGATRRTRATERLADLSGRVTLRTAPRPVETGRQVLEPPRIELLDLPRARAYPLNVIAGVLADVDGAAQSVEVVAGSSGAVASTVLTPLSSRGRVGDGTVSLRLRTDMGAYLPNGDLGTACSSDSVRVAPMDPELLPHLSGDAASVGVHSRTTAPGWYLANWQFTASSAGRYHLRTAWTARGRLGDASGPEIPVRVEADCELEAEHGETLLCPVVFHVAGDRPWVGGGVALVEGPEQSRWSSVTFRGMSLELLGAPIGD